MRSGNVNRLADVFQGSRDLHFQRTSGLQLAQGVIEPLEGMKERLFLVEKAIYPSPVVMVLKQICQQGYEEK
jgi:hypothetical protein